MPFVWPLGLQPYRVIFGVGGLTLAMSNLSNPDGGVPWLLARARTRSLAHSHCLIHRISSFLQQSFHWYNTEEVC